MAMSAGYIPFHPNPSKPKYKPPAGAVDLQPRFGELQGAHRPQHGLLERGGGRLGGRLDLARPRHSLRLSPARGQREPAPLLGERRVERVELGAHRDPDPLGLAHARGSLAAVGMEQTRAG